MSNSYYFDERDTSAFPHQGTPPVASAPIGSYLVAVLIGAYVLFQSLEVLGYPVWLWLHSLLQMAIGSPPFKIPLLTNSPHNKTDVAPASEEQTQKSEMQGYGSNVLSGMFGLNSGGLLGKGVRGVTGALAKTYRNVPAGLGNWDNSCYQNSVIQGMASLPSFRDYLSKTTTEYKALDTETTNGALFDMINKLNNPENHGQQFWIRGKLKSMSTFQQQDAQEYYSKILDELDKELLNASTSKRRSTASWLLAAKSLSNLPVTTADDADSKTERVQDESSDPPEHPQIVPNPLDGLLAQRVGCIKCGYTEGLSLIPFNCITVPLGRAWAYDVRDCLAEYTNLELIEGVECAKCTLLKRQATLTKLVEVDSSYAPLLKNVEEALEEEDFDDKSLIKKCGLSKKVWTQTTKSRQAVIARAPKSLVLHVNRSIFDEMTGAQYKNNADVMYPKVLDLGHWCLGSSPSNTQQPDDSIQESWPRDPTKSMLGEAGGADKSSFQYALKAAVTHFGNHGNGHYVCYRQHPFKTNEVGNADEVEGSEREPVQHEQWWRLSDENVYEVSEEEAVRQSNVFMLFYERVDDTTSSLPSAHTNPTESVLSMPEQIPLPPETTDSLKACADIDDDTALLVPLPADDTDRLLASPLGSPRLPPSNTPEIEASTGEQDSAYPLPPPESLQTPQYDDTEPSEADTTNYDSEDAPSTQLTSDDDTEFDAEGPRKLTAEALPSTSSGPHRMRTAGDVGPMTGEGGRPSLPLVPAT